MTFTQGQTFGMLTVRPVDTNPHRDLSDPVVLDELRAQARREIQQDRERRKEKAHRSASR